MGPDSEATGPRRDPNSEATEATERSKLRGYEAIQLSVRLTQEPLWPPSPNLVASVASEFKPPWPL